MGKIGFRDVATNPFVYEETAGGASTALGIDYTDSSQFKMIVSPTAGSTPAGTASFVMTTGGQRTLPLQSAFLAYAASAISNVTGDGTVYTMVYSTVIFDQNSNFDGTSTFTAPVTGKYWLNAGVLCNGVTSSFTGTYIQIVVAGTSARTYQQNLANPGVAFVATNIYVCRATVLAPMTAGDTAIVQFQMSGSTKTISVFGSANTPVSFFNGNLVV